jgi:SAM-dependent methyltransferase
MEILKDFTPDERLIKIDQRRFDYFIPNYLLKYVEKTDTKRICSVGCGMAYDVEMLGHLGYDAYGFDPGGRTSVWKSQRLPETQNKLFIGAAGDPSLERFKNFFDYAYALEVIEHVGTKNGIWELKENYLQERIAFMEGCLDILKPGGTLLVSTSNRACPIDIGHGHHYNRFTNFAQKKLKLAFTIPWSPKNFVCTVSDIEKYLDRGIYKGKYKIRALSTSDYPSNSKQKSKMLFSLLNTYLKIVSLGILRTSFLNPILVVEITKK